MLLHDPNSGHRLLIHTYVCKIQTRQMGKIPSAFKFFIKIIISFPYGLSPYG